MANRKPDKTFYPSPKEAVPAPPEKLAYVALLNAAGQGERDGIGVIDLDPESRIS